MLSVRAGDMILVDAGTVHAIWPGSVLLETQQNCDLTYRMYDYGRGRELHIEKSLEAVQLKTKAGKVAPRILEDRTVLVESQYFCVERIPVEVSRPSASLCREDEPKGMAYLFAAEGSGRLASPSFAAVDLPAARNRCGSCVVAGLCDSGYGRAGFDSHYAAMARDGCMTMQDWRKSVVEYIRVEAQPEDKFGHQPRLYALAGADRRGHGL